MSDSERPMPQYGEYASGEELASARARAGVDPSQLEAFSGPSGAGVPRPPVASQRRGVTSSIGTPRHNNADRLATVFLLSFGAVIVITGGSGYLNLGDTIQQMAQQLDMAEFHPTPLTAVMGVIMLATQIVFWIVAAVWSYRRLSRQKLTWWVPLLMGALSFIALTVMLASVLLADPSFLPALQKP